LVRINGRELSHLSKQVRGLREVSVAQRPQLGDMGSVPGYHEFFAVPNRSENFTAVIAKLPLADFSRHDSTIRLTATKRYKGLLALQAW